MLSAGSYDASSGGELPAVVPQRNSTGQQCGVHEGKEKTSTNRCRNSPSVHS